MSSERLGIRFIGQGLILSTIGGILFLIVAFRDSVMWGLGGLFLPFMAGIFLILHCTDIVKPFGTVLVFIGFRMFPAGDALRTLESLFM